MKIELITCISDSSSAIKEVITCFEDLLSHMMTFTILKTNVEPVILKKYNKTTYWCCLLDEQR